MEKDEGEWVLSYARKVYYPDRNRNVHRNDPSQIRLFLLYSSNASSGIRALLGT
jgi:hypothetical protein